MMRNIIRLVLPVAVLTFVTGMLPVLPTDIGRTNQLAQLDSVVGGGAGSLINGNGNSQFEQRLEQRQTDLLSGGSGSTITTDPYYYQVIPQAPTAPSQPQSTTGGSSASSGSGAASGGSSAGSTASSPSVDTSTPVSRPTSNILPGIDIYGQANQIIQQQFQQQHVPIIEAPSLGSFAIDPQGGNTLSATVTDCQEKCDAAFAEAYAYCSKQTKKDVATCENDLTVVYNAKRGKCVTDKSVCDNWNPKGDLGGSAAQPNANNLQIWIPESTKIVTLSPNAADTANQGNAPLLLLPGTANVSLSPVAGYVPVQVVAVRTRASDVVDSSQSVGGNVLQVEKAGDLLNAIALNTANEITGTKQVRTTGGAEIVVPTAKTAALNVISQGIGTVFTNISGFFSGLLGNNSALVTVRDCEKEYNDKIGACFTQFGDNVKAYTSCVQDAETKKKECEKANESSGVTSGGAGVGGGSSGDNSLITTGEPVIGGGRACGEVGQSGDGILATTKPGEGANVISPAAPVKQCGGVCDKDAGTVCGVNDDGECGCVPLGFSSPTTALTCPSKPVDHDKSFKKDGTASDEVTITREKGVGECVNAKTTCVDTPVGAMSGNYSFVVSSCETVCENEQKSPETKSAFQDRAYNTLREMENSLADTACANAQAAVVSAAQAEKTVCDASCPNDGEKTNCQACGIKGEIKPGECGNFQTGDGNGVTFSANVKSAVIKVTMTATAEGSMKWQAKCGLSGGISVADSTDGGSGDGGGEGGGGGSGGSGGGARALDLPEIETNPTPLRAITSIPSLIGNFVRENIFGAIFGITEPQTTPFITTVETGQGDCEAPQPAAGKSADLDINGKVIVWEKRMQANGYKSDDTTNRLEKEIMANVVCPGKCSVGGQQCVPTLRSSDTSLNQTGAGGIVANVTCGCGVGASVVSGNGAWNPGEGVPARVPGTDVEASSSDDGVTALGALGPKGEKGKTGPVGPAPAPAPEAPTASTASDEAAKKKKAEEEKLHADAFTAWDSQPETCAKYSGENIKQAIEDYEKAGNASCPSGGNISPWTDCGTAGTPEDPTLYKRQACEGLAATCGGSKSCTYDEESDGCTCSAAAASTPSTGAAPAAGGGDKGKEPTPPVLPVPTTTKVTLTDCKLASVHSSNYGLVIEGEGNNKTIYFKEKSGSKVTVMNHAAFAALSKAAKKEVLINTKTSTGKSVAEALNENAKAICEANVCKAGAPECHFTPIEGDFLGQCGCPTPPAPTPSPTPSAPSASGGAKPPTPPPATPPVPPVASSPTNACTYTYQVDVYFATDGRCPNCELLLQHDHSGTSFRSALQQGATAVLHDARPGNDWPTTMPDGSSNGCRTMPLVIVKRIGNPASCGTQFRSICGATSVSQVNGAINAKW